jgi:hypothetical protein
MPQLLCDLLQLRDQRPAPTAQDGQRWIDVKYRHVAGQRIGELTLRKAVTIEGRTGANNDHVAPRVGRAQDPQVFIAAIAWP